VALGSNLEDPQAQVRRGFEELAALPATRLIARSRLRRTAPVGYAAQPDFVNGCALVETELAPRALLDELLAIERRHGRVRAIANGPRTLDLDIVLYGDRQIDEPGLQVPHPRAHERAFVLEPLLEVWPDAVIPGRGAVRDLLAAAARSIPAKAGAQSVTPAKAGAPSLDPRLRGDDNRGNDAG
jgi:2-amino-4-hydroxy-6-hydroxymethyldihydropteridine diphosphokinase